MQRGRVWSWLGVILLTLSAAGQGISTMAPQPRRPFLAGTTNSVWIFVVNDTSRETKFPLPARLGGDLILPGQPPVAVTLEAADARATSPLLVEAESFGKREYLLRLPDHAAGRGTLEFDDTEFNSIRFDIASMTNAPAMAQAAEAARDARRETFATEPLDKFFRYFSPYEPIYFLAGSQHPTARFQMSLKYHVFDPGGPVGLNVPLASDLYVGYTQTALWDIVSLSSPFFDTSYKPGVFLLHRDVVRNDVLRLDLQGGYEHESNGRDGANSRSQNTVYVQPTLRLGREDGLAVTLTPRGWLYVLSLEDNPDIAHYRGYADLIGTVTWKEGLQLATLFRIGDRGDHTALQFDLSYPLWRVRWLGGLSPYLHAQYFAGYGESLLGYNRRSFVWRLGLSLYR